MRRRGVPQGVVQGLLGDPARRLLLGGAAARHGAAGEGTAGGVRPVEQLDLRAQGGDQAVLVQGGGAQLDDERRAVRRRPRRRGGDLLQLGLGAGRVAVDQRGGGLGGQAQGEELLGDRVVQLVGDAVALLGDGQLAAALVEAGVGQGDRGVRGEQAQQFLVVGGEARRGVALVGEEQRAEDLLAVA